MALIPKYGVELTPPKDLPLKLGDKGPSVKRLQEWLSLNNYGVVIDGDFGPATERALKMCTDYTVCDLDVWNALSEPLINTSEASSGPMDSFPATVVNHAKHTILPSSPVEVGGDNKGPWVRHYCRGYEVAWCQGFASTVWNDAARSLGVDTPFNLVLEGIWCLYVPRMVTEAQAKNKFISGQYSFGPPSPGSMFFLRGGPHGYSHVGIVTDFKGDVFETVEGNTNDDGSANGYKVCRRIRKTTSCDFGNSV